MRALERNGTAASETVDLAALTSLTQGGPGRLLSGFQFRQVSVAG